MSTIEYIGFDIHKKTISFCAKAQDGTILEEGTIPALRNKLLAWAQARPRPWIGARTAAPNGCATKNQARFLSRKPMPRATGLR